MDVYKFVNSMYKGMLNQFLPLILIIISAFDNLIPQYGGELVKRTGDGIIAMFGLEGKASKHADRAVYHNSYSIIFIFFDLWSYCSLAMMNWCNENGYNMRIGIASGDVGSGIFGDGNSRPAWDVLGECVNLASRYAILLNINSKY